MRVNLGEIREVPFGMQQTCDELSRIVPLLQKCPMPALAWRRYRSIEMPRVIYALYYIVVKYGTIPPGASGTYRDSIEGREMKN